MATNLPAAPRLDRTVDRLWTIASAPQALIVLAIALAVTLALGAVFPQAPAGLAAAETDQWLANAAASYRGAGSFLRSIGAFQVLDGLALRLLLAAAAFSLALRAAAQARFLWTLRRAGIMLPFPPPGLPTGRASLDAPPDDAVEVVRAALASGNAAPIVERTAAGALVYASRRTWALAGPLATYAGVLLVLCGLFVQSMAGWYAGNLALAQGEAVRLGQGDLRLTLDALHAAAAGEPARAEVTIRAEEGDPGRSALLGFARPALRRGVWLAQRTAGPALAVAANEGAGRPLLLQAISPGAEVGQTLRVRFQQTESEQGFAIPSRNLTFRAVSYASLPEQQIDRPVFLVEGYRGEDPVPAATGLVEDEATLELDGVSILLQRDRYVILAAAYLPGLWPIAVGGLLLLAGVAASAFCGPARWWAGVTPSDGGSAVEVRVAAAAWPAEGSRGQ